MKIYLKTGPTLCKKVNYVVYQMFLDHHLIQKTNKNSCKGFKGDINNCRKVEYYFKKSVQESTFNTL